MNDTLKSQYVELRLHYYGNPIRESQALDVKLITYKQSY